MRCWLRPKRPMPQRMRSTARIGTATNCRPSYSGGRAGCRRSRGQGGVGTGSKREGRAGTRRGRTEAGRRAKKKSDVPARRSVAASPTPDPEQAKPDDTAQRNFTDPESRIMPDGANKGSFVQGYNAQMAVDSTSQVIVAAEVTQETTDKHQLLPMLGQVEQNLGRKPEAASADAGYWSEANATDESVAGIDLHIATGRDKHEETIETTSEPPLRAYGARSDAAQTAQRGRAIHLQNAQSDRRAGLRTDQGAARFSALQPARPAECSPRVEAGVPGVQSAQAVRLRVEAAAGIKSGRKLFRRPAQTCQPQSRRHHIMVFPRNARS